MSAQKSLKVVIYNVMYCKKCLVLNRISRSHCWTLLDRLRDTLIHEMCHAATWLINGVRDGHGNFWKLYARKSTLAHPELPMVTRCHSYDIKYKFQYQCTRCQNTYVQLLKHLISFFLFDFAFTDLCVHLYTLSWFFTGSGVIPSHWTRRGLCAPSAQDSWFY